MEVDLRRPTPYSREEWEARDDSATLPALGYGAVRKDMPLELLILERRLSREDDVVISIMYCGVCHSDWHVLKDEWKNSKYPIVTGHEVVGRITEVGSAVTKFRVGDLVGLGPNIDSCKSCTECHSSQEQYCSNDVTEAYNMPDRLPGELKPTGPITQGGFSTLVVADHRYVLRIPRGAKLERVGPLLCAGATMWTPLTVMNVGRGTRVGIAGYGGLGHIGAKIAKSMGATVTILTTTLNKTADALEKGADGVLWVPNLSQLEEWRETFDLIVCTIPFRHDMDPYLDLLKSQGVMWVVGAMMPLTVDFDRVNRRGKIIRGSSTAGIKETQACLDYCVSKNIYPDVTVIAMKDLEATREAIVTRQVRYRYVVDVSTISALM